jgi:energy-coupling factor transport system permease protein
MRASFLTNTGDGFAAKLDVRVKLLLCFAGSITTIVLSSPLSLGLLASVTTALALGAARPATILKVYLVSACMFVFAFGFSALIGLAVPDLVRWSLFSLAVPFLRMLVSINLLLTLALSTPVHVLFARLQSLRLPPWLHIPLTVAIRFIPTFLGDCAQIRDAARLRPGKGLSGLWRGIAVPLVFRMLYSADDLAVAAELKGIGSTDRVFGNAQPAYSSRDGLVLALSVCVLCAAVILQQFGPQFRSLPM